MQLSKTPPTPPPTPTSPFKPNPKFSQAPIRSPAFNCIPLLRWFGPCEASPEINTPLYGKHKEGGWLHWGVIKRDLYGFRNIWPSPISDPPGEVEVEELKELEEPVEDEDDDVGLRQE